MKKLSYHLTLPLFLIIFLTNCGSSDSTGVKLVATVSNLGSSGSSRLFAGNPAPVMTVASDGGSTQVTPTSYKLALVNFWLIKDDDTEVSVLNPDSTSPTYTEASPLIVDFTSEKTSQELLSVDRVTAGTYTGYKMQFLYMEMEFPVFFHLPGMVNESDYPTYESILDTEVTRFFRLYFNAIGKYWKRDFVVELDSDSDEWFWLRRQLEDDTEHDNFFIAVSSNDHPVGGAGSDSTIDLFADEEFWGAEEDYSSSANPIIVGTHSTAGGVNAFLQSSFTIPATIDTLYTITLDCDVTNTMNFGEGDEWTPPAGVTFTEGTLDLGPSYTSDTYGDGGLHPMLPRFDVTVTTG